MAMSKLLIHIPPRIKAQLDDERKRGTSASGLIRFLLEKHFERHELHKAPIRGPHKAR